MSRLQSGLAALVVAVTLGTAQAATSVSLIGDKDGLGLGLTSGDGFNYNLIGSGDGDGTDVWHDGNLAFVHDYAPSGPITSASLELASGGWGFEGLPSLYLNGSFVGHLTSGDHSTGGPVLNYLFKDTFDLTPFAALLTGHDTFEVRLVAGDDDAGALDYSQLTVSTNVAAVPEPSQLALIGIGLAAIPILRRRRRR